MRKPKLTQFQQDAINKGYALILKRKEREKTHEYKIGIGWIKKLKEEV